MTERLSNYPALSIHQTVSPEKQCLFTVSVYNGPREMVGLTRFELVTPRLSSVCSNQLSYRPGILFKERDSGPFRSAGSLKTR